MHRRESGLHARQHPFHRTSVRLRIISVAAAGRLPVQRLMASPEEKLTPRTTVTALPALSARVAREPTRRSAGFFAWLITLLCMMAAAPAILVDIYKPDVTDRAEARALATSIHTWKRINSPAAAGERFIEEIVPHYNGQKVWMEPPGTTWTHLLAFELLAPRAIKAIEGEALVSIEGRLTGMAEIESIAAAGLTADKLGDEIARHLEKKLDFKSANAQVTLSRGAGSEPPPPSKATPGGPPPILAAGDKLKVQVRYVEPRWRAGIDTIQLIEWGRLVSAIFALITVGGVFWAGHSIGGIKAGVFSALICAANPSFIWHARLASPTIHITAWSILSIAAALWAIRPLKPAPSIERQFLGWVVCGVAMGLAAMMAGPVVVLTVALPILVLLLMCPHRRGHLMGLVAALLIGVLVVVPWTAMLLNHVPDAAQHWLDEHQPFGFFLVERFFEFFGQRFGIVLLMMLPWTLWLIAAVGQPFSTSVSGLRTQLFLGLAWFGVVGLMLFIQPDTSSTGGLLALVPAASVMIGQVFLHFTEAAAEGRFTRFWRMLRWPQILIMLAGSIVVPMAIAWPALFAEWKGLETPLFFNPGWWFGVGLMIVLTALTAMAGRMVLRQHPGPSLAMAAAWMLVLATVAAIPLARGPRAKSLIRPDARTIAKAIDQNAVFVVQAEGKNAIEIDPAVLLYAGCQIQPIATGQIDEVAAKRKATIYLVNRIDAPAPLENLESVADLKEVGLRLWRYPIQTVAGVPAGDPRRN